MVNQGNRSANEGFNRVRGTTGFTSSLPPESLLSSSVDSGLELEVGSSTLGTSVSVFLSVLP